MLLALLCLEALAWLALALLSALRGIEYRPVPTTALSAPQRAALERLLDGRNRYLGHDPVLGWRILPGGEAAPYRANAQGLRADADVSPLPSPGRVRVSTWGESFTHGDEVGQGESWPARLQTLAPTLEVLNFGVPAYGPDQVFWRYATEGRNWPAAVAIFALGTQDLPRVLNRFRPFLQPDDALPLAKPRFRLGGGMLLPVYNPLPRLEDYRALLEDPAPTLARLGAEDPWFQAGPHPGRGDFLGTVRLARLLTRRPVPLLHDGLMDTGTEAFRVLAAILDAFASQAAVRRESPIFLLLPDRTDLARLEAGKPPSYQPLGAWLGQRDRWVIDAAEALRAGPGDAIFLESHYSPEGNDRVAKLVLARLEAWGLAG